MGGSDQWGNIVMGVDLGRRMGTHQLHALTTPLLQTSSGAKMGKTAEGAVWLNEEQMSAYDFWQYWRNTEDADVAKLLKLFTTLPMPEIARLAALKGAEINEAKKVLATEATTLMHGRAKAEAAAKTAQQTFEQGATGRGPADGRDRGSRAVRRHRRAQRLRQGGPRQVQRRGAAPDCRRRPARQRRGRQRREQPSSRQPT